MAGGGECLCGTYKYHLFYIPDGIIYYMVIQFFFYINIKILKIILKFF